MKNLIFAFIFSISIACAQEENFYRVIPDQNTLSIKTPDLSERRTVKLRLSNDLEVYLISDPKADQSAAALSVEVGSWSDPEEYPGMAHFLEHMLFMGNGAYPEEEGFSKFTIDNSGNFNAYTSTDRTVYMFSVNHEVFELGLDQFSHFFIDPLFNPSSVGRELHAVDQENDKNLENDSWREWMILKETGNQQHPNSKFSTGNANTLGKIPIPALKAWFEKNYSANLMHLVVYSSLPIEKLTQLTANFFSKIPQNRAQRLKNCGPLLSPKQFKQMICINPVQDIKQISLTWELPLEFSNDLENKTPQLVAHALSQDIEGGLFEQLKKEGYAENLNAQVENFSRENALFILQIELTKKGVNQIKEVLITSFQAINQMKKEGIPPYVFNELQKMAELRYSYQSRIDAFEFVMKHAHALIDEPFETYPEKTVIPSYYSPKKVQDFMQVLTPENCAMFLTAPSSLTSIKMTNKEKWLGGEYTQKNISNEFIYLLNTSKPSSPFVLSTPNPFIPSSLKILSPMIELNEPKLIGDDISGKAYFAEDPKYQVPESVFLLGFKSPVIDGSARQQALLDLYLKAIQDKLSPLISQANSANLYTFFYQDQMKFHIKIYGYSEKAPAYLNKILSTLKTYIAPEEKFLIYKEQLLSEYESREKSMPFQIAFETLSNTLYNDYPTGVQLSGSLGEITYDDFTKFSQLLFSTAFAEGLFTGNLTEAQAKLIWQNIKQTLSYQAYPLLEQWHLQVLVLPNQTGPFMIYEKTPMQGNAVLLCLQEGPFSFEKRASQKVLEKALAQSFFATLRTKQQTAYIAKSWATDKRNELQHFFCVQSSTHQPLDLIARFELFLEGYVKDFEKKFPEERFDQIRNMLISKLLMPLPNLDEYAARLNKFAFSHQGDFLYTEKLIMALRELTYEKFKNDTKEFLSRQNTKRIAVLLEGSSPPEKSFKYKEIKPQSLKELSYLKNDASK